MKAFSGMKNSMALDASIYTFYATATARIFHDALEKDGFKVGAGLVWKKDQLVLTRTDWKYIHEPILFGWRKDGKHKWYGDQKQKTVFEFDRIKNSKDEGLWASFLKAYFFNCLSRKTVYADQTVWCLTRSSLGVHAHMPVTSWADMLRHRV